MTPRDAALTAYLAGANLGLWAGFWRWPARWVGIVLVLAGAALVWRLEGKR